LYTYAPYGIVIKLPLILLVCSEELCIHQHTLSCWELVTN